MNFQTSTVFDPLRVLIFNALCPTSKLIIAKIMSGFVFGQCQLIDLSIVVYSNEIDKAEMLKTEVESCAFPCMSSIKVSSDLPSISDGDVFCFITNFSNPNIFNFENGETEERFDTLYLITKLANNFSWPNDKSSAESEDKTGKHLPGKLKQSPNKTQKRKPIFIADGLIAVDILYSLSKNMPSDVFFCFTPLTAMAKSILGEYLNVQCKTINEILVWAANDEVFHIEVEKPLLIHDEVGETSLCDSGMIGKDFLESLNLDPTQFNATWMKKDFIDKVASYGEKNPYGSIYKAAEFAKALKDIWKTRDPKNGMKTHSCNMGVISDGSLGTEKGLPYILPINFNGEKWSVSKKYFEDNPHLKQELKRINSTAKTHHKKLITHCKKFLEENVINQAFIPSDVDSGSVY
ncbi:malate dehydrogenase-like [Colias croceus]|uniref:malate dehydrogenase-like n=1 Tax=Colias crocea TaxID=72248 RepID=UPI001E27AE5A|nr:malate dehydrogenase-like [Colias croceus]